MRARPSRAVSLLVTSVFLTGLLGPGALAQPGVREPAPGPEAAGRAVVDLDDIPAEPPVRPARPPVRELFGADCDTRITGSTVVASCHNGYPETDLLRLHVECERWWDVDGDGALVPLDPAGRTRITGRCWKEVRTAWVSHQRTPEGP
ncbi:MULTISPECIES: hypothetical protein [Streptomyces]|uniref:hypothetical protein n=1 Tax=Streptomyces TaxID=1883 RepID=UPI000F7B3BB5|nr:hypothetical protein [Streptomyces sp. WAC07149]RSS98971.1 hypothetical protein EF910_37310 [Streptomyces sp. WAC07149]GLX19885.1 hypothetical protein Slala01_35290 [Streptomyces lavendulae subsp. lavendulae]GLX27681.1 hypothetical protein Slala02_35010 [Streptomyces lavendulae subsp. lavendulae]